MRSDQLPLLLATALIIAGVLTGCADDRTVLEASIVEAHGDYESELDFWDDVATRYIVTNNDALHGLLLLAGYDPMGGYESRLQKARQLGWTPAEKALPPNESATVGMMAVAVCDILDIRGGVTMMLLGPSPRYCTRELVFLEIIPMRTENQSLTGLQFIDLISRVEDEMAARTPEEAVAADLAPGEDEAEAEPEEAEPQRP